jgi:nucleotide-binding universal stress UspA family protein
VRLITVAIHTYERALALRTLLENEGVEVVLDNVNLESPTVSSGVRVRIKESDLPLALRIIENTEMFMSSQSEQQETHHSVIVPTDFSDNSNRAVGIACQLASELNAQISILHSYIDPYVPGNMQITDNPAYAVADKDNRDKLLNDAKLKMKDFTQRLFSDMKSGKLPMVKFSHKIVEGVPEDAIIEYTKINPPILIVMGTRSNDRKEREMIGSVTAEVLNGVRCSVLTVPENGTITAEPKNILFFCNLDQADIIAADSLYRLFSTAQAKITMVHIPAKKRYGERKRHLAADALIEYCRENYNQYSFTYTTIDAANRAGQDIKKLEQQEKFDMIVVPNRKRNAWSRLFNPGLAQRIIFHSDTPTLIIPV